MKLTNIKQVEDFIAAVNRAHSNVWLVSPQGDRYNMKSALSQYIALGALLGQHGDELELFVIVSKMKVCLSNFLSIILKFN